MGVEYVRASPHLYIVPQTNSFVKFLLMYCCIVAKGGDIVVKKHNKAKPSGDAVWRGENGCIVVLFRF